MPLGVWECVYAMQASLHGIHTLSLSLVHDTHSRDLFFHCERVKTAFLKVSKISFLENRKVPFFEWSIWAAASTKRDIRLSWGLDAFLSNCTNYEWVTKPTHLQKPDKKRDARKLQWKVFLGKQNLHKQNWCVQKIVQSVVII